LDPYEHRRRGPFMTCKEGRERKRELKPAKGEPL